MLRNSRRGGEPHLHTGAALRLPMTAPERNQILTEREIRARGWIEQLADLPARYAGSASERQAALPQQRGPRATSASFKVKWKVEPWPGCDSTQMRPPWRSTIFLQVARPMPEPGYSAGPCRR